MPQVDENGYKKKNSDNSTCVNGVDGKCGILVQKKFKEDLDSKRKCLINRNRRVWTQMVRGKENHSLSRVKRSKEEMMMML